MRWGRLTSKLAHTVQSTASRRWGVATLATIGLLGIGLRASAQGATGVVSGRVTDAASGTPLVGASIRIVGSQTGAQTGEDGRYTIRGVPAGAIELQANRIGYEAKRVTVAVTAGQTATLDVTLSAAAFSLSAVVTTVTGEQKKAEMSNTVATIDVGAKVAEVPANSLSELLSGRAPGVQISSSGAAGGGSRIRIRGQSSLSLSNSPVVYVDGIKVSSSAPLGASNNSTSPSRFDDINPEEIETIDILKGPAAATLYGTEAANGVINITTKKGKAGRTRWTVFTENGISQDPSAGNYRDLWIGFDNTNPASPKQCFLTQVATGACRIDSLFHNNVLNDPKMTPIVNGNTKNFGLQVSGGTERNQYFVSGDYNNIMGPYKMPGAEIARLTTERGTAVPDDQVFPNADKKINLRANLSTQLGPKADFSVSVGYIDRDDRQPPNEDNANGLMVDAIGGGARTDGLDSRNIPLNGYRSFPMGDILAQTSSSNINRFTNSLNLHVYPFSWLSGRANFGYDYTASNTNALQQFNQGPFGQTARLGSVTSTRGENDQYTIDVGGTATLTPRANFGSKTSVGIQGYRSYNSTTQATGQQLPPGATTATAAAIRSSSQATSETITVGTYGEQVFSYADRVFLTGGLRYDGNSAFGKSFKGVFYPKVGVSWLMSQENWFPKTEQINSFRLRGAYGASGVQPGSTDATRYFSPITATLSGAVDAPGVQLNSIGNQHLKPEYSGELETGFDATLFQNRTTIELTYYNKKTKDALIARPVAPSLAGLPTVFDNLGSIRNAGIEATLNQRIIDNNQVGFEVQVTGSTNKNRILTLGEGVTPVSTGNRATQYNAPGYPLYGLWGKTVSYNDANNDGIIAANELTFSDTAIFIGSSYPTLELGINPRLELFHRKLAIAAQFDHKEGMNKFDNTLRHQCSTGGQSCRGLYDKSASLSQQAEAVADNVYSVFTPLYENGKFTRFRELSVSYQLPDRVANAVHSSRALVVFAGRNLHVWTPYTGVDPEATVGNGDERGNEEYFGTPPLRFFTLRFNLAF